jgi:hypothetical protein
LDFTLLNGGSVSAGNQIGWFIAAQDLSTVTAVENFITNQAGGIATVSPAVNNLTAPFGTSTANYLFYISNNYQRCSDSRHRRDISKLNRSFRSF